MPGKKAPIRYDRPHGNQSVGAWEKKEAKKLGLDPEKHEVRIVHASTGRKVKKDAGLGGLRSDK